MKEIIYLDIDLMNSMLAQLDEGLINSYSLEQHSQETDNELSESTRGKKAGLSGEVNVGTGALTGGTLSFGANLGNEGTERQAYSKSILEGQNHILNKAFHDYALEVLIAKLEEEVLLVTEQDCAEGDLYLSESTYRFYDFGLISKAKNSELMQKLLFDDIQGRVSAGITIE
ncbi:hypothetical protein HNO89_003600 [Sporosarcina luteola]|nr:hypothetical protein [Sporosarcina luteola]